MDTQAQKELIMGFTKSYDPVPIRWAYGGDDEIFNPFVLTDLEEVVCL